LKEKKAGRLGVDKAETLLKLMCRVMAQSRDVAEQCRLGDALKALLDVSQNAGDPGATPVSDLSNSRVVGVLLILRLGCHQRGDVGSP
jgi:hypothetical protein